MSEEMIPLRLCVDLLCANAFDIPKLHLVDGTYLMLQHHSSYRKMRQVIEQAVREMAKGDSDVE